MHINLIFNDREAEFLRELVRQDVDFMIVGLSAAALQGTPVVTQDVELWFKDLEQPGIKKATGRDKDKLVLPVLSDALIAISNRQ